MYTVENPCYIIKNDHFLETVDEINKRGFVVIDGDSFGKNSCFVKTKKTDKDINEIREQQNGIITELFIKINPRHSVEARFGFDKMPNCS